MIFECLLLASSFCQWNSPPKPVAKAPVADRKFVAMMAFLGAAKAFDMTTTARQSKACTETNPLLGPQPSNGRIVAVSGAYYAGEIALAYVLKRTFRNHKWLGKAWLIEPIIQSQSHIHWGTSNIVNGCAQ